MCLPLPNGKHIAGLRITSAFVAMFQYEKVYYILVLQVSFNLYLSRKAAYYGLNILTPCIMIVLLALLMFWLPADSGEKVSLGITCLLAFSVFQLVLADNSPKTSDFFPVLSEYYYSALKRGTCVSPVFFTDQNEN